VSKKKGRRVGQPAVGSRRPRASDEDVMAANGVIATRFVMEFRCNRVRTADIFLFQYHLSRARVK